MLDEVSSLPIQGVSINWDKIDECSYLREIEAIKGLDYLAFNKNITIFVGENGSGKSTMLEAIAVCYGFKEVTRWFTNQILHRILISTSKVPLGHGSATCWRAGTWAGIFDIMEWLICQGLNGDEG